MGFLPNLSIETWTLLVIFLTLCFMYGTWTHGVFKKLGVPGPKPLPFIGTFHGYRNGMLHFDLECFKKYGNIWGIYDGRLPLLAVTDPALIKSILVKECFTHFTNRRNFGLNGPLECAVANAKDENWKRIRTVLSPTFTSGKLKEMFPIIKHFGDILVRNVQKKAEKGEVLDVKQIFGAYSTDVIISTSFGVNVDSMNNPNDPFVTNGKKLFNFRIFDLKIILAVIFPFLVPIMEKMNLQFFSKEVMQFYMKAVNSIKEKRQKGKHEADRVDFLQLMLDSQTTETIPKPDGMNQVYKALTDEEIMAQAVMFILAGYEATSSTLSFLAYDLATHPDVQQRLQKEIDKHLPNKAAPTYDTLMQMEYLDMVMNEILRMYPGGGRLERVCKQSIEINGQTFPEGMVAMIPLFVLHRNPEYWPEPDEFNPERFSKENKETQAPYSFLPFGAGPRNCIGMRFALLNMKVAATFLLQHFTFQTCSETKIPLELDTRGSFKPKYPIILKLVPRSAAVP